VYIVTSYKPLVKILGSREGERDKLSRLVKKKKFSISHFREV